MSHAQTADTQYLLTFGSPREIPTQRAGRDFEASYKVVESRLAASGDAERHTTSGVIRLGISRSLQAQWGVPDSTRRGFMLRIALGYLSHHIKDGRLIPRDELQLTTYNAPPDPPFDVAEVTEDLGPHNIRVPSRASQ